jgi:hypothetical protein
VVRLSVLFVVSALAACNDARTVDTGCDDCKRLIALTLTINYTEEAARLFASGDYAGGIEAESSPIAVPSTWSLGNALATRAPPTSNAYVEASSVWERPLHGEPMVLTGRFEVPGYICVTALVYPNADLDAVPVVAVASPCVPFPADLETVGALRAADDLAGIDRVDTPIPVLVDTLSTFEAVQLFNWRTLFNG